MNESEFILTELEKGHAGEPWHGPSRAGQISILKRLYRSADARST